MIVFSFGRCWSLAALFLGLTAFGCGRTQENVPADAASAAALSQSDAAIMQALDPFDPIYLLNRSGRVVNLRLTDKHISLDTVKLVVKLTALEKVALQRTDLTNAGLAVLADSASLKTIALAATKVSNDGLASLAKLKSLRELNAPLSQGGGITEAGLREFKVLRPEVVISLGEDKRI